MHLFEYFPVFFCYYVIWIDLSFKVLQMWPCDKLTSYLNKALTKENYCIKNMVSLSAVVKEFITKGKGLNTICQPLFILTEH